MKNKTKSNNNSLKKKTGFTSLLNKIFNTTPLLYIVFFIACINIFNLITTKNDESLFLFILISVIVYDFNKNMIFVLGIPLIIVNTLLYLKSVFNKNKLSLEGMETTTESDDMEEEDMEDEEEEIDEMETEDMEDEDMEDEDMEEEEDMEDEDMEDEDSTFEEAFKSVIKAYSKK